MASVRRVDDLDRALVHALQIDGRAPFRRIADVLGVSDQTIARRYARLRAEHGLRVIALTGRGGVHDEHWLLRLRTSSAAAAEVAAALARRDDTFWVSMCSGGTDLVVSVIGAGAEPLLNDVLPRTPAVHDVQAHQVLRVFEGGAGRPFTKSGPLTTDQIHQLRAADRRPMREPGDYVLTEPDQRILAALRSDARVPIETLATTTASASNTVRRRLRDLLDSGVVHLDVDVHLEVFDLPLRTMLWLHPGLGDVAHVGQTLSTHPEITFAAATTGPAGLVATAACRDARALFDYLTGPLAATKGTGAVETASITRTVKTAIRTPRGRRQRR